MIGVGCRATAVGLAASMLAGCATPPAVDEGWISGRLSVRVEAFGDRPGRAMSADFELRGDDRAGELRLTSALGTRLAQARWSRDDAVLDLGQGPVHYADLEALARESLGEAVPLRAFPDWLAGRPWAGAAAAATAQGFAQLGWVVSLAAWSERRVEAVRDAPPRVVVRVRLAGSAG